MFISDNKSECFTGSIKINQNLQIEEYTGQINHILRLEKLDLNWNFSQLTEGLKKNFRFFFEKEVLPVIEQHQIRHLLYERKNSILSIAITPLNQEFILISFEETKQAQKQSEQLFPEKLQDVMIRINPDMQVTYISKNCLAKLGKKASDLIGKALEENQLFALKTPDIIALIAKVFQLQKPKEEDIQLQKGEKQVWMNLQMMPENDPDTKQQSVLIVLKNINRYKIIEEKLSASELRYQMAIESADLGIWDYSVDTGKTFYSRRWKSMLGYYPDELTDNFSEWENLLHPEDKDRMIHFFNNFLNSDLRLYDVEFRMKHKNGYLVWIRSRAIALSDQSGKIFRIIGTHRDISEEKKSESEFKKLHQAILQSPIAVVITDKDGYIEFFNPAFCKITGWSDQEIIGKKPSILKSGFQTASYYEKLWKTISSGNEWQGELKNRKKNGNLPAFHQSVTVSERYLTM